MPFMVKRTKDVGEKVGVQLPKKYVKIIDKLVRDGEYLSRADFVRDSVRRELRRRGLIEEDYEDAKMLIPQS